MIGGRAWLAGGHRMSVAGYGAGQVLDCTTYLTVVHVQDGASRKISRVKQE